MNKYELTEETKEYLGVTLYRIRALTDFSNVKAGALGGWIEGEKNLSQYGNSWVYGNARVYENARVFDNAVVCENAEIRENAFICENAKVCENAVICKNAVVKGAAAVCGNAMVFDNAVISENAVVKGNAVVFGDAIICDNASVFGNVVICENALIYENAVVKGFAKVCDNASVCENAVVKGVAMVCVNAWVGGNAVIGGNAEISEFGDIIQVSYIGSRKDTITIYRGKENKILVNCGCFEGTLEEFSDNVKATHGDNIYAKEYALVIELAKVHFKAKAEFWVMESTVKNTIMKTSKKEVTSK